jgi:hypothetical protein
MVKVIVPNKHFEGIIADVQFKNGIGEFSDLELAKVIAEDFGFELEELEEVKEEVKDSKPVRKSKKKTGE